MSVLPIDDLCAGQKVTILNWLSHRDRSWCGDVLVVKVVELPYIVVDDVGRGNRVITSGIRIDTRDVELQKLSDEYVTSVVGEVTVYVSKSEIKQLIDDYNHKKITTLTFLYNLNQIVES